MKISKNKALSAFVFGTFISGGVGSALYAFQYFFYEPAKPVALVFLILTALCFFATFPLFPSD